MSAGHPAEAVRLVLKWFDEIGDASAISGIELLHGHRAMLRKNCFLKYIESFASVTWADGNRRVKGD